MPYLWQILQIKRISCYTCVTSSWKERAEWASIWLFNLWKILQLQECIEYSQVKISQIHPRLCSLSNMNILNCPINFYESSWRFYTWKSYFRFPVLEYGNLLESMVESSLTKQGSVYICNLCGKECRDLTRAREHLEAKHFPSSGYSCPHCSKHCKTKHALTCHISVYHRASK